MDGPYSTLFIVCVKNGRMSIDENEIMSIDENEIISSVSTILLQVSIR